MKATRTFTGLLLCTVANAQESVTLYIDYSDSQPVVVNREYRNFRLSSSGIKTVPDKCGTDCGTLDAASQLAIVVERWPLLSPEVRALIMELVGQ